MLSKEKERRIHSRSYKSIQNFRKHLSNWEVSNDTIALLEEFTCVMYGRSREKDINNARYKLLLKMVGPNDKLNLSSKVNFARHPPCWNSLLPHIYQVNYRLACFKKAGQPIFELPLPYEDNNGWQKDDNGFIEPIWTLGPILPLRLVDVLEAMIEAWQRQTKSMMSMKMRAIVMMMKQIISGVSVSQRLDFLCSNASSFLLHTAEFVHFMGRMVSYFLSVELLVMFKFF